MPLFAPWSTYFAAQAGAAGALAGLIFVALSFNFERVLRERVWLVRAATGLILLALPVVTALVCLWPAPSAVIGLALAVIAAFVLLNLVQLLVRRANQPRGTGGSNLLVRLAVTTGEAVLTLVGGIATTIGWALGVYLVAIGSIYGIAMGLYLAWVLLVEIRRLPAGDAEG